MNMKKLIFFFEKSTHRLWWVGYNGQKGFYVDYHLRDKYPSTSGEEPWYIMKINGKKMSLLSTRSLRRHKH